MAHQDVAGLGEGRGVARVEQHGGGPEGGDEEHPVLLRVVQARVEEGEHRDAERRLEERDEGVPEARHARRVLPVAALPLAKVPNHALPEWFRWVSLVGLWG